MKRLTLNICLLFFVLPAAAQSWTACDPFAYSDETVVYLSLQSNIAEDQPSDFIVAAFIGGECRSGSVRPVEGYRRLTAVCGACLWQPARRPWAPHQLQGLP